MIIDRKEFLNVLTKIKPGVGDKSFIEHSENFIFDNNIVYTNNNEIAVIQNFETKIKGALPAKKFYELISKLKENKISLKEGDNEVLIRCGKTRAGIKIKKEISSFPIKTDKLKFEKLPDNFLEGLRLCSFSVSKDLNKFPLNYLYIRDNQIIGCDNFRLTHYTMNKKINKDFLFPLNCIDSLFFYNPIKYCIDNQIYFADKNNTIFVISNVDGDFPKTENLLEVEGDMIEFPEDFIESISRSSIMSDSENKKITIEIHEGKIKIEGKGSLGWIKEDVEINSKISLSFSINAEFLKDILNLGMQIVVGKDRVLFENENLKHIAMTI